VNLRLLFLLPNFAAAIMFRLSDFKGFTSCQLNGLHVY
jgi:hypothetical protein